MWFTVSDIKGVILENSGEGFPKFGGGRPGGLGPWKKLRKIRRTIKETYLFDPRGVIFFHSRRNKKICFSPLGVKKHVFSDFHVISLSLDPYLEITRLGVPFSQFFFGRLRSQMTPNQQKLSLYTSERSKNIHTLFGAIFPEIPKVISFISFM